MAAPLYRCDAPAPNSDLIRSKSAVLTAPPAPEAASHDSNDHSVRFYDKDQRLLDEVSEFLGDGGSLQEHSAWRVPA
jgi:hypothetical protein